MKHILADLEEEYVDLLTNKKEFKNWLKACKEYSKDGKRLLYCIAIDTKNELIDKDIYCSIFDGMKYPASDWDTHKFSPLEVFRNSVSYLFSEAKKKGELIHVSNKKNKIDAAEYFCLIPLVDFVAYTLKHQIDNSDFFLVDKHDNEAVIDRLENDMYSDLKLSKKTHAEPFEISWVATMDDYDMVRSLDNDSHVTSLINALGLMWKDEDKTGFISPKYVLLKYPKDIEVTEDFHQPNALNGNWTEEDGLYLSENFDSGFGKSRPRTDKGLVKEGVRERVHYLINNTYTYSASYFGESATVKKNTSSILKEAEKRYAQ